MHWNCEQVIGLESIWCESLHHVYHGLIVLAQAFQFPNYTWVFRFDNFGCSKMLQARHGHMAMGLGCYRLLQRCSILPITELMGIIWWPLRLVFRPLRQAGLHSAASLLARRLMDSVWQSDSVWWDLCISRMVYDSLTLSAQVFGGVSTFFWSKQLGSLLPIVSYDLRFTDHLLSSLDITDHC
jgi:hypothetical protein